MQTEEAMTKILANPPPCICVLMQQLPWRCGHDALAGALCPPSGKRSPLLIVRLCVQTGCFCFAHMTFDCVCVCEFTSMPKQ